VAAETALVSGTELPVPTPTLSMEPDIPAYARQYRLLNTCDEWSCLFAAEDSEPPYLIGYASLRGYYSRVHRADADEEAEDCDGFVIVEAPEDILSAYEANYSGDASVLSRTADNLPIINVDLSNQDEATKASLTASAAEELVEIRVLNGPPIHRGIASCFSPVVILGAVKLTDASELTQDYEITEWDNSKTFTYAPTTRFTVVLDPARHPLSELECEPEPMYGEISNVPDGDASMLLYPARYEITRTGMCLMRNGDFQVTIVAVPLR
jgi:hypothetical protein